MGRALTLKSSPPRSDNEKDDLYIDADTVHISYEPKRTSRGELYLHFRKYPGFNFFAFYYRFCFVRFVSPLFARKALKMKAPPGVSTSRAAKQKYKMPYPQPVDDGSPSRVLHVTHLPANYTSNEIVDVFSVIKGIQSISLRGKYGYICFDTVDSATLIWNILRTETNIVVSYARNVNINIIQGMRMLLTHKLRKHYPHKNADRECVLRPKNISPTQNTRLEKSQEEVENNIEKTPRGAWPASWYMGYLMSPVLDFDTTNGLTLSGNSDLERIRDLERARDLGLEKKTHCYNFKPHHGNEVHDRSRKEFSSEIPFNELYDSESKWNYRLDYSQPYTPDHLMKINRRLGDCGSDVRIEDIYEDETSSRDPSFDLNDIGSRILDLLDDQKVESKSKEIDLTEYPNNFPHWVSNGLCYYSNMPARI